jgi:hypothetical protein
MKDLPGGAGLMLSTEEFDEKTYLIIVNPRSESLRDEKYVTLDIATGNVVTTRNRGLEVSFLDDERVESIFPYVVTADSIKLVPQKYHSHISLRAGLLMCNGSKAKPRKTLFDPITMAPAPGAFSTANVSTELTITAVDYTKLMADSAAVDELVKGIKTAFVVKLGPGYTTNLFNVTLSSGSVKAKVDITPPKGKDSSAVVTEVNAKKAQIRDRVNAVTLAIPTISSLTMDGKIVADIATATTSDAAIAPVPTPAPGVPVTAGLAPEWTRPPTTTTRFNA